MTAPLPSGELHWPLTSRTSKLAFLKNGPNQLYDSIFIIFEKVNRFLMTYKFQIFSLSIKNTFIFLHAGGTVENNSPFLKNVLYLVTSFQKVQYERKGVTLQWRKLVGRYCLR